MEYNIISSKIAREVSEANNKDLITKLVGALNQQILTAATRGDYTITVLFSSILYRKPSLDFVRQFVALYSSKGYQISYNTTQITFTWT